MANDEILALERYILSSDKSAALSSFPPTSTLKQFLFANSLLKEGKFCSPEFLTELEELKKKDATLFNKLQLRKLIKELETTNDETKTTEILNHINYMYFNYNFDYPAPQSSEIVQENEYSSRLSDNLFPNNLHDAHTSVEAFESLTENGRLKLNPLEMNIEIFKSFIHIKDIHSIPGIPETIVKFIKSSNFYDPEWFELLSASQLSELKNLYKPLGQKSELIRALVSKKYLYHIDNSDDIGSYEIYQKVLHEIEGFPENANPLRSVILLNLLSLGRIFNNYDEKIFKEYLKIHRPEKIYRANCKETEKTWKYFSRFLRKDCPDDDSALVQEYLQEILKDKDNANEYEQFFEEKFLRKAFARIKIQNGICPSQFEDVFSYKKIEDLASIVELEPSTDNPFRFERNQLVKFSIHIKNIQRLLVKVLELNTKAYYLKNDAEITTDINLDGLVASYERIYEYNDSPLVRIKRTFEFPELTDKAGLFVMELIGNGRHCRTLIKKGSLKFVSKITSVGHIVLILNESNQICKGPGAGLILDGRFYSTENDRGTALIPFANQQTTKNIILTDGIISSLESGFTHYSENYELKTAFLVHEEQLLIGNRATISIKPRLYVCGTKAPDSLLKECKAAITTTDADGITASRIYPDLAIPSGNDLINLDIEVPPRLKFMRIWFSGEVEKSTTKEKTPLNSSYKILVNSNLSNSVMYGAYLRYGPQGYQVELRGRGGEILPRQRIQVSLSHEDWGRESKETLMTDENGTIYLGILKNIASLRVLASVNQQDQQFEWILSNFKSKIQYPSILNLCEGDEFGFPVTFEYGVIDFRECNIVLEKNGKLIDNFNDKLFYDHEASMLWLKGLKAGVYLLKLDNQYISVSVKDGIHWGENQFILSEDYVIPTSSQYRPLGIKSAEIEENKVKIELAGDYDNAVIHILYFNYLSTQVLEEFSQLQSIYLEQNQTAFKFSKKRSYYLPSRKLDQEYQYVLERKFLERNAGNILTKPQLLNKRLFLYDTTTETQRAQEGERMKNLNLDDCEYDLCRSACPCPAALASHIGSAQNGMLDFLKNPAKWTYGLNAQEGKADITLEKNQFSHALIIATNGEGLSIKIFSFTDSSISTRQLGLSKSLDKEISYSEQMKSRCVFAGENFTINDISSCEIVDSIDKLYRLQKELITTNKIKANYEQWEFLGKWHSLSNSKRLEKYDKYMSHELNLFLYKKDYKFFEEVIKPLLASKMEKDIIDLYLLSHPLDDYMSLDKILKLNSLEKILLIESMLDKNPEFSVEMSKIMKDEADSMMRNYQLRNRRIKTALSFNLLSGKNSFAPQGSFQQPMAEMRVQLLSSLKPCSLFLGESIDFPALNQQYEKISLECCDQGTDFFSWAIKSEETAWWGLKEEIAPTYYQKLDSTKEFAETFYYDIKDPNQNTNLVPNRRFWSELASAVVNRSSLILSEDILETTGSLTELICSLAFSDLPFIAEKHDYLLEGRSITYTARSNFIAFYKELAETPSEINSQVLVAQRYFDPDDRYIQDQDGNKEKSITQFIKQKIYTCQVVITNTAGSQITVSLLTEVPQGSIPILPPKYTLNSIMTLANFHTKTFEYQFYFPNAGVYSHYPVTITYNGKVIAKANSNDLEVSDTAKVVKLETFKDLVLSGRKDLVLEFLANENLYSTNKEFNVNYFCWMMKDKEFWQKVMQIMKQRNYFFDKIWSFAFLHKDFVVLKEIFTTNRSFMYALGEFFSSELLSTGKGEHRHLEFDPLVNERTHRLGNRQRITNIRFEIVYSDFLKYLSEKERLDVEDQLALTQYYILQDRYQEANEIYKAIPLMPSQEKPGSSYLQIQYDYLSCYLDINLASAISALYENYPVNTWKKMFSEVAKLVREINAQDIPLGQAEAKDSEPSLMFTIERNEIKFYYQNVRSCIVKLYRVDLEVLFSKTPFLIGNTQNFGFVKPNYEFEIELPENGARTARIPEEFEGQNIIVEVDYGIYTISKSYFATSLKINVIERYGIIKVMNGDLTPRPSAYIKAFVQRKNGSVEFYKDGYTDIRGNFDYAALNTDQLSSVHKFALLVVDDELGSLIYEVNPPPQ
ncbi:unnamed protein product [Blepharisma stoltei]|uniref:Uncharacterized protein n=1 Tax=Blepharisma stoltei TaxID=1481888 RepID=A0AAU9I7F9_9CILI|nr:unnamed protein product [Blepharisma stoltei]